MVATRKIHYSVLFRISYVKALKSCVSFLNLYLFNIDSSSFFRNPMRNLQLNSAHEITPSTSSFCVWMSYLATMWQHPSFFMLIVFILLERENSFKLIVFMLFSRSNEKWADKRICRNIQKNIETDINKWINTRLN